MGQLKTLLIVTILILSISARATDCMSPSNKKETLRKINAIRSSLACDAVGDFGLCSEHLALTAAALAAGAGAAAALNIRKAGDNMCAFAPSGFRWPNFLIEEAWAKQDCKPGDIKIQNSIERNRAIKSASEAAIRDIDVDKAAINTKIQELQQDMERQVRDRHYRDSRDHEKLRKSIERLQLRVSDLTKTQNRLTGILKNLNLPFPNLTQLTEELYKIGRSPSSINSLLRLQQLDLADSFAAQFASEARKKAGNLISSVSRGSSGFRMRNLMSIKGLLSKAGVFGLVFAAGSAFADEPEDTFTDSAVKALGAAFESVTGTSRMACADYHRFLMMSDCKWVYEATSLKEDFFSFSDAEIEDYFKAQDPKMCHLIEKTYLDFYPNPKVTCGATISIKDSNNFETIIRDPQNNPPQLFTFIKPGLQESYKLDFQEGVVKRIAITRFVPRGSMNGNPNFEQEDTELNFKSDKDQAKLLEATGLLSSRLARVLKTQACCNKESLRPSDADCASLGLEYDHIKSGTKALESKGGR